MSNINKLDGIPAVEDLTDAAAAAVGGGFIAGGPISLDFATTLPTIRVSQGGSVNFKSSTREGGIELGTFAASLRNTSTGRTTSPKTVAVGAQGSAFWSNVRGGFYQIDLTDTKDKVRVRGSFFITTT